MARHQRANFSVSLAVASWKLLTGPSQKKKPNMPEMLPPGQGQGEGEG